MNKIKSKGSIFIPLAFLIVLISCFREKQYTPQEILMNSYNSIKGINSACFGITGYQKYFYDNKKYSKKYNTLYFYEDTLSTSVNLMCYNEESNTFGYGIYRNRINWNTDTDKRELYRDTSELDFREVSFRFFANRGKELLRILSDTNRYVLSKKGDTIIEKNKCYIIEAFEDTKLQGDTTSTYDKYYFYISQNDFVPRKIIRECDYLGEIQREEVVFRNFKIYLNKDSVANIIDSKLEWCKQNYKQIEYSDVSQNYDSLMAIKISKIDFKNSGLQTINGENVDMYKQKSKLTLIDFWYVSCHPCLEAIPSLNKLYRKYKKEGLNVIGINAVDKDTALINKIIRKKDISYTIYKDGKKLAEKYNVYGFPTFFILDENYNVIHREIGFVGGYKRLDSLVSSNLQDRK